MASASLRRLFWWQDTAGLTPERIAAQVMVWGTWDDVREARRIYGNDVFAQALAKPPRGVFDAKSWTFWHKKTGRIPVPPLPPQPAPWPPRR